MSPDLAPVQIATGGLVDLALKMLDSIEIDNNSDDMGFMGYHFARMQVEHLKSINVLVAAGQYGDSVIIARNMMVGLATITWAGLDSNVRPHDWRVYSWVEQFRNSYGKHIDPSFEKEIETMLDMYCKKFLADSAKGKPIKDIIPSDYLTEGWRREYNAKKKKLIKIVTTDIFKSAGLAPLYPEFLDFSARIHWDPFGLYELHFNNEELKNKGGVALVVGFYSLYISLKQLNSHFQLSFDNDLDELYTEFDEANRITHAK